MKGFQNHGRLESPVQRKCAGLPVQRAVRSVIGASSPAQERADSALATATDMPIAQQTVSGVSLGVMVGRKRRQA